MPLVWFDEHEWYPVHDYREVEPDAPKRYYSEVDIPQETLDRWDAVFVAFRDVQAEMFFHQKKAERERERIERMPVQWWSIVIRTEGSYNRHGFYGKEIDVPAHIASLKEERKVDFYSASDKHRNEYEIARDRELHMLQLQERLEKHK